MLELLTVEIDFKSKVWIYPFKHLLVFEPQIRKYVLLLSKIDVDALRAKDLLRVLSQIALEVAHSLGPKRDDFEYSEANIEKILMNHAGRFETHFGKARQGSPPGQKETEAENGINSKLPVDRPDSATVAATNQDDQTNLEDPTLANKKQLDLPCTCLRDAKEQLQLLVKVVDEQLADLLGLRKAIFECSLKKIRFRDLWNLYQSGDLVVSCEEPCQAYRVIFVCGGRLYLQGAKSTAETSRVSVQGTVRKREFRHSG